MLLLVDFDYRSLSPKDFANYLADIAHQVRFTNVGMFHKALL
jgi:hypothetical protein